MENTPGPLKEMENVSGSSESQNLGDASGEVIPANKRWRFLVLGAAGLLLLASLGALWALGRTMNRLDQLAPEQLRQSILRLQEIVAGIACLGGAGFLGAAGWLFRLGWKINRTGQYPPPGMRVLWTTRVCKEQAALLRANIALFGSVLLGAIGTVGMVWLYQLAIHELQTLLPGP